MTKTTRHAGFIEQGHRVRRELRKPLRITDVAYASGHTPVDGDRRTSWADDSSNKPPFSPPSRSPIAPEKALAYKYTKCPRAWSESCACPAPTTGCPGPLPATSSAGILVSSADAEDGSHLRLESWNASKRAVRILVPHRLDDRGVLRTCFPPTRVEEANIPNDPDSLQHQLRSELLRVFLLGISGSPSPSTQHRTSPVGSDE
ncbi:hypothetical protein QBC47DRAFT_209079 [Echria macrotheca]|uniref:Uncharacterized protein n=1 Tax=Echria macrotheca TaxID=438768 RepID=A0AAJ0BB87_9PEZI|nr:hypothetical protein QBC47DRAFT_209079 [Echria macrotheca]